MHHLLFDRALANKLVLKQFGDYDYEIKSPVDPVEHGSFRVAAGK